MKSQILDVSGGRSLELPVDAALSLEPFIRYLEARVREEQSLKANFYRTVLDYFEQQQIPRGDIPLEEIGRYEHMLEYIFACLTPALMPEKETAWGLSFPMQPILFYGSDLLYEMLSSKPSNEEEYLLKKTPEDYHRERLLLVYGLILQQLYDFQIPVNIRQYHAWEDADTGLLRYYEVNVNTDFLEVRPKGELPAFDFNTLYARFCEEDSHAILQELLPLGLFLFRGFAVVTVTDVTAQMAVENIRKVRLSRISGNEEEVYGNVIRSLKTLVGNNRIEFDLFPFVRVNGQAVYGYVKGGTGILFAVWGEDRMTPEEFRKDAEDYMQNPKSFFSPDINKGQDLHIDFLDHFRTLGVRSLALMPLFYDDALVGVFGMHTWQDEYFDEKALALLEPAYGPVAQLLQIYIDEFNLELEAIIKEKYTSIQPAVQWKFNEAAWHYLHSRKKNLPLRVENIRFEEVYPLYGAVDIRNSTVERNAAIRADLDEHLRLLSDILEKLQSRDTSSLMQELRYHCSKWQQVLAREDLSSSDENNLNTFLNEETREYLVHLARQQPAVKPMVDAYLQAIRTDEGVVYRNRQALENAMQQINNVVNNYFEEERVQMQRSYPCYFEKFRTDGIEYDIYIGQSIAPDIPFSHFHLKNLRLWQLSSMAAVARLTRGLLHDMSRTLRTTQLIFVHNHTIDISFRADERKFDVEGAYNIRYQMIKKRIDKVHIRNTTERLTQPDTIALIYFHQRDVEDYLPFVRYLQETNVLTDQLEELELEDLQGLSGLRALRVGVVYPDNATVPAPLS